MPSAPTQRPDSLPNAPTQVRGAWFRIWHPLLVGLIPILSAYMSSRQEVAVRDLLLPVGVTLGLSLILWALLAWALKSSAKAALLVSVLLLAVLNFDVLDDAIALALRGESEQVTIRIVLAALLVAGSLLYFGIRWTFRRPRALRTATLWLNAFTILVLVVLLAPLISDKKNATGDASSKSAPVATPATDAVIKSGDAPLVLNAEPSPRRRPDIYYLILDSYARSDMMREVFGFDNRAFLERLQKKGFYVANRSTANYCQTFLSLSSSLNLRYHDSLQGVNLPDMLHAAFHRSVIATTLRKQGYRFVSYATGFRYTELTDADEFLSPPGYSTSGPKEFHALILDKTPYRLRSRFWSLFNEHGNSDEYTSLRERTLHVFHTLGKTAQKPGPKFVFAHVLSPHPPFVFGDNGDDVSPRGSSFYLTDGSFYLKHYGDAASYNRGYRMQATYITKLAERAIDDILKNSAEPPIIILQSDHGSGARWTCDSADPALSDVRERLSILNAYYLPDGGDKGLYENISPVNSFRIILNNYFGAKLPLLSDECFLSSTVDPFRFVNVSDRVRQRH